MVKGWGVEMFKGHTDLKVNEYPWKILLPFFKGRQQNASLAYENFNKNSMEGGVLPAGIWQYYKCVKNSCEE